GVEDLTRLLGVAVGEQLHRALQIGEEHGDLLALALEGALRRQDSLGEVLRRIGFGRSKSRRRCWRGYRCECCAAAIAELAPGVSLRPPAWVRRRECPAALPTETGLVAVICLAPWALHAGASEHSGSEDRNGESEIMGLRLIWSTGTVPAGTASGWC